MIIVNRGGGGVNLYNADGTLTENRTVTGATYNLTFNTLGDLKFNSKTTGYLLGYYDVGDGRPEFVIDCPSGGNTISRMKSNGTDVLVSRTIGTSLWEQYREWQVRSIVTNNIHMIRDIDGQWLFTNDATGLQTPESGVRAKFYGQVKTVSPSASSLDTAFSVRNNTDTSDIFKVLGNTQMGVNGTNVNSQFNINNSTFAWGLSVFQNKAFEDAIYISAVSGRAGYFISNSAVGVEAVNETGANYAINALGKYDGTGKALKTFGEVRMDGLQTYADNATAVVALGTNRLYYRTGHGLDITV